MANPGLQNAPSFSVQSVAESSGPAISEVEEIHEVVETFVSLNIPVCFTSRLLGNSNNNMKQMRYIGMGTCNDT